MARKAVVKDPEAETTGIKKRPGRQPMTAEEKEAAARVRAEEKERAANLKPEIVVQYQGSEIDMATLVEAAKADLREKTYSRHSVEIVCQARRTHGLLRDQ